MHALLSRKILASFSNENAAVMFQLRNVCRISRSIYTCFTPRIYLCQPNTVSYTHWICVPQYSVVVSSLCLIWNLYDNMLAFFKRKRVAYYHCYVDYNYLYFRSVFIIPLCFFELIYWSMRIKIYIAMHLSNLLLSYFEFTSHNCSFFSITNCRNYLFHFSFLFTFTRSAIQFTLP